ncbi:SRPBCC family protein [Spirilliplanes yamanashiensis]|uniref:Polyketide cyclase/dehydrase n=1 Tax=Spirilliplanes yamanashiensis TaxID=42233 RepID=A0A8J4DKU5_9ACTN|nr:SRPBCC family protein [Spirilliplanes yamanashiensis]MDP9816159.1 hypothetical protein [Spirilliplanes yamanashiensis]GIJ05682.1 hypothetical protein Sya03_50340 [Spirilliplanes yamanashiensis]
MSTRFTATVEAAAPAARVWDTLVDWPRHGDWVPLTKVRVTSERPDGVGAVFVTRTGVGPLAFDDPMRVTEWQPPTDTAPGRCAVLKLGRLIHGTAWFEVIPQGPDRTQIRWHEDVTVTPHRITRLLSPVLAVAGRAAFTATLKKIAKAAER